MKEDIKNVLQEWLPHSGPVYYYPNPGNAGDALIAAASWQVFGEIGLHPVLASPSRFEKNSFVILGGGGNLIPFYSDIQRALEHCLAVNVRQCLLLPHTIRGHEQLLSRLDGRFTLCCRDLPSFEHVALHAPFAKRVLADDMAFSIDINALEKRTATLQHRYSLFLDKDWRKSARQWRLALALCNPDEKGVLNILRADREARSQDGSRDKALDLPDHYRIRHGGRAGCDQVAFDLFHCLRRAKAVVTDRLHVALPSALLGLSLEAIDNNYGKLSAVFDLSLPGKVVIRER